VEQRNSPAIRGFLCWPLRSAPEHPDQIPESGQRRRHQTIRKSLLKPHIPAYPARPAGTTAAWSADPAQRRIPQMAYLNPTSSSEEPFSYRDRILNAATLERFGEDYTALVLTFRPLEKFIRQGHRKGTRFSSPFCSNSLPGRFPFLAATEWTDRRWILLAPEGWIWHAHRGYSVWRDNHAGESVARSLPRVSGLGDCLAFDLFDPYSQANRDGSVSSFDRSFSGPIVCAASHPDDCCFCCAVLAVQALNCFPAFHTRHVAEHKPAATDRVRSAFSSETPSQAEASSGLHRLEN
jgi:hypothetical protein